ncbi:hypothetical protein THAOC_04088, partial [Thalassiosira oceanica]
VSPPIIVISGALMAVAKSSRLSATNSDARLQIDERGIRPHPPARTGAENKSTPWERFKPISLCLHKFLLLGWGLLSLEQVRPADRQRNAQQGQNRTARELRRPPVREQLKAQLPGSVTRRVQDLPAWRVRLDDPGKLLPDASHPALYNLVLLKVPRAARVGLPELAHAPRARGPHGLVDRPRILEEGRVVAVPQPAHGVRDPLEQARVRPGPAAEDLVAQVSELLGADGGVPDAIRRADYDHEAGPTRLLDLEEVVEVHDAGRDRPSRRGELRRDRRADLLRGALRVARLGAVEDQDLLPLVAA